MRRHRTTVTGRLCGHTTADGQGEDFTAKNCVTGNQTTKYVHGTTLSDSTSRVATCFVQSYTRISDDVDSPLGNGADGIYDRVEHKYNRQGKVKETKDQNETVHAFDFDKLGRQTQDRVTTLGSGVDGAVRRIARTYEVRGMVEKLTSYDNATVGSGAVVNEVQFAYNSFGQLTTDYQSHSGSREHVDHAQGAVHVCRRFGEPRSSHQGHLPQRPHSAVRVQHWHGRRHEPRKRAG